MEMLTPDRFKNLKKLKSDQLQTLLGLATTRLKDLSDALERNWLIQMICAGVGLALIYKIAELPELICKYVGQGGPEFTCTLRSEATVLIVVQLYYFMKFGHQLTAFIDIRKLLDGLLEEYVGDASTSEFLLPLRESTSFFEGYYSRNAFSRWAPGRIAYFLLFFAVVACGQAAALFLLFRGYGSGALSILLGGIALLALAILYVGFWSSKKDHPHTTSLVVGCMAVIAACLFIFSRTAA